MHLSIIIVNYKTPGLVMDCLAGLMKHTEGISFDVTVVDNDSGDDTEQRLIENYPAARFIQMGYNAGFARANNAGIRQSTGDAVLLLNSDTLIKDNAIGNCFNRFIASNYVACGIQLLNEDGTSQISGSFFMKGGVNMLLPLPYLGSFLKFMAGLMQVKKPNVPEATGTVDVDWINGAYLMVKRDAINAAGLMDEDFFLYAEESEWCCRLGKVGKLCIYGDQHIVHLEGSTANAAFDSGGKGYFNIYDGKGLQIMVSNFLRVRKQYGVGWFLFNLFFYCADVPVFGIGLLFAKLIYQDKSRYSFAQWKGFTKNIFSLLGLTPKILRGKAHFYKLL